ncbi:Phage lysozyme [Propionivibrio dicarboxylicus]|uniref:Lysozyme n=2 Tax=Propionivibrio dicarboxylicus TaxID=83767 RepID=A0A1G8LAP6_9RHOO|nr:Phage lysozyme [Propionivibrio dicarboxylicus]
MLLARDLEPLEIYLSAVFPDLTQNEFDALASFCFNVGLRAFETSTMFRMLKAGDKTGAANEFGRWIHGGGKELPGLVRRRADERDLFLGR